jgi:hypothetical protein
MVGVLALSFLGSMLTPAGPEGLLYPLRYVDAGDWGLAHISEWQSPNFHDISQLGLLLLISAVLLNGMRATPSWLVAVATLGIAGALLATRNAPVAALLTLPTLALGVADRWRSRVQSGPTPQRVQVGRRLMELTAALVVIAAAILIVPRLPTVAGASVISRNFPVVAVDQLEERQPDARVLAEYHWGGYVINRLYDMGGRVFVDGRNDMYSDRILDDYVSIRNAQAGWLDLVDRYGVQAIVLPPDAAVTQGAATANGWCEAYRDNVAVLLLKTCAALGGS